MAIKSLRYLNDPDGIRLPIKVDSTSNGEFIPQALSEASLEANKTALKRADQNARRLGQERRKFLVSVSGAASTLLAFNEVNAASGSRGSSYVLPFESGLDEAAAKSALDGDEFIFDVQGHHVGNIESWAEGTILYPARHNFSFFAPQINCSYRGEDPEIGQIECLTGEAFVKEVFLDSDTDIAILSFGPAPQNVMNPSYSEGAETMRIVEALDTTQRLLLHGRCMPTYQEDLDAMEETSEKWEISAWKTYTQHGPKDTGYYLDDDLGRLFIDKARQSGTKIIAVHKGLPFLQYKNNLKYALSRDIGPAARENPDMKFLVYHSGYDFTRPEGPYNPNSRVGVDVLIKSLLDNNFSPENNKNVYAELGTTWRYLMRDPDQAAHVIGKLLKYVGEDKVLWGTDSIWYGSPQDQIMAFRAFQISEEFQEKYGYPKITDKIRSKIFGLNAAEAYGLKPADVKKHTKSDPIQNAINQYADRRDPSHLTYGPKNRREFLNFLRQEVR